MISDGIARVLIRSFPKVYDDTTLDEREIGIDKVINIVTRALKFLSAPYVGVSSATIR